PLKREPSFKARVGAEDKTVLLYVGRLAPEKDLDILIRSFGNLNKYHPGTHLVITGAGPLEAGLKREAPPNVTFTGYLHGEELAEAYASSDIFLFPSTTETYGNVILEAMASGLPVVAPCSGGVKENLFNLYNGLACRPRNCADMVKAAIELIENESLRKTLAGQARAHALTRSWDNVINKLVDGYAETIAQKSRKTA
ncbi:MAG: glycosyltransferase, partial [Bacillota bacterium]